MRSGQTHAHFCLSIFSKAKLEFTGFVGIAKDSVCCTSANSFRQGSANPRLSVTQRVPDMENCRFFADALSRS